MYKGAADFLTIEGRVYRFPHTYPILIFLTLGVYAFIGRLYPSLRIYVETKKSSIIDATHILVIGDDFNELCTIRKFFFPFVSMRLKRYIFQREIRFFETQCTRFFYDIKTHKYMPSDNKANINFEDTLRNKRTNDDVNNKIVTEYRGKKIDEEKYEFDPLYKKYFFTNISLLEKYILYSSNDTELKPKPLLLILGDNLLAPLFIYILSGIILWFIIDYVLYGFLILILTVYSLFMDIMTELKKNKDLRELAKLRKRIIAFRDGEWVELDVKELFPGDIFYVEATNDFPCDAKIIKGEIIVDESFLTGETVPVFKAAGVNECIVYAGTKVLKSIGDEFLFEDQRNDPVNAQVKVRAIKKRQTRSELRRNSRNNLTNIEDDGNIISDNINDYSSNNNNGNINVYAIENNSDDRIIKANDVAIHDEIDKNEKIKSGKAICITISTRYDTAKGRLIKNILIPKKMNFVFEKQSKLIIFLLFLFGAIMAVLITIYLVAQNMDWDVSASHSIDLIFCLLSPALPVTIWIGSCMAVKRLSKKKIVCNESDKINLIGKIDHLIFDKTGTLTEEGLDLYCIDDIYNEYYTIAELQSKGNIWEGLSVCHSVYEVDNQLIGDPLDIKMFMFSHSGIFNSQNKRYIRMGNNSLFEGPLLMEMTDNDETLHYYRKISDERGYFRSLEILRVYEFDNKLRRMGVVVKDETNNMFLYVKGSPESIHSLLIEPDEDFFEVVNDHSLDGFRVLAMGYKKLDNFDHNDERSLHECNLSFLSFIVFANKLKPETKPTLESLHKAELKTIMATGDGILTAISVGRQAKLIDKFTPVIFPVLDESSKSFFEADWLCIGDEELVFDKIKLTLHRGEDRISYDDFYVACEGREYDAIRKENNEFFRFLMERGVIFARMNPDQKRSLVEDFKVLGKTTLFCGDGANDCGALRSADIGLALTENEASLASSFTSTVKNISSVLTLIKEGRCALTTSFSRFQFVLLTCFIQYISLLALMMKYHFLSELQTTHLDLLIVLPIAYIMTEFNSSSTLSSSLPEFRLFRPREILRVVGHVVINTLHVIFTIFFFTLKIQDRVDTDTFMKHTYISTIFFFLTSWQTITIGVLLMKGEPHREPKSHKKSFIFMVCIMGILLSFLMCNSCMPIIKSLNKAYEIVRLEAKDMRFVILFCATNGCMNLLLEFFINNGWILK